ncbi:MAG: hypothetical protein ACRYGR_03775 [Janthinobacterium lividum]
MKKIMLTMTRYLALLIFFITTTQSSSQFQEWDNESKIQPYFNAIQFIKQKLEIHVNEKKSKNNFFGNDFEVCISPNGAHRRTPRYLYLQTYSYKKEQDENLYFLWTPFGKVELLGHELFGHNFLNEIILGVNNHQKIYKKHQDLFSCSKNFLQDMKKYWTLRDVTQHVQLYHYVNFEQEEKLYGPCPFSKFLPLEPKIKFHLYLIEEINNHNFIEGINTLDLIIYEPVNRSREQHNREIEIFSKLSNGLNKF